MADRLTAYIDGDRAGVFTQNSAGVSFVFDEAWRHDARRLELSLSMLKSRREHIGSAPLNYLWNLLPDNVSVLQRWGTRFSVSPRNPVALLAHVGMDTAGAVQLSVDDGPVLETPSSLEPIGVDEIEAHIQQLRQDPQAWLFPGHESGYFSLAGAQPKFALAQTGDGWSVPIGRAASTHIFKPGIAGLSHSDLNEHLTMTAAGLLGLDVAASSIERFGEETAIVITRYDRIRDDDHGVRRIHQEDFAQARGIHPASKYQNEGGPGIFDIVASIRDARGRDSDAGVRRFFEATLFNWAALGTDAHAKNYALLHDRGMGPRLAPLYDLASALAYPDLRTRNARLAMSYGRHYSQFEIEPRHIFADADAIGLESDWVVARANEIVDGLANAYSEAAVAAQLSGEDAAFAATLIDQVQGRARHLRRELDRTPSPPMTTRSRRGSAQLRNKDTAGKGNPGAFAKPADGSCP